MVIKKPTSALLAFLFTFLFGWRLTVTESGHDFTVIDFVLVFGNH
jgi:hypothetical protein